VSTLPPGADVTRPLTVLVFSRTTGFRHESIPAGIEAVRRLGQENGFPVDATEDPAAFTSENLARYDVVVWLSTSGDVLDDNQRAAFEGYVRGGGSYVGVHGAADTEYDWPWYGGLVGAYFREHPEPQAALVRVENRGHPSTVHLTSTWARFDEWYDYRTNPRSHSQTSRMTVLLTVDESTYQGGGMGQDHPIAWCHVHEGGRAFYTGLGHTVESFEEPAFLSHLLGGIKWAGSRN
jgi:type 1 glutamine amidotransferase